MFSHLNNSAFSQYVGAMQYAGFSHLPNEEGRLPALYSLSTEKSLLNVNYIHKYTYIQDDRDHYHPFKIRPYS